MSHTPLLALFLASIVLWNAVGSVPLGRKTAREVGGSVSRTAPGHVRHSREVGGAITRNYPGLLPQKRDLVLDEEEIWTVVQSDEENLTMDSVRGKDVPLSLTEDFRGIEPVMPQDYARVFLL